MTRKQQLATWLAIGLLGGAGCRAPIPKPSQTAPQSRYARSASSAVSVSSNRSGSNQSAAEREPEQSLSPQIRPADPLPPCRPTSEQARLSVTRFLQPTDPVEAEEPSPGKEFQVPPVLPGADAPPLDVPEFDPNTPFEKQKEQIREIYKPLPKTPEAAFSPELAETARISLAELQQLAYDNSPVLAAAMTRVEQARGRAIQAGLYPNPATGYIADAINTGNTDGRQGVFAKQTIVTADKLNVRRSVQWQDVVNAEYELRRTEIDLATKVRRNYVRVLIAQERLKLAQALEKLFKRTYKAHINLVAGGESAAYEPLQLRVFAVQAQNNAIEAGNDYVAAWRQLAAVMNRPDFQPRLLDGAPEMPLPEISYQDALDLMLARHTDLSIASTQINKGEWNLHLQRITPIPDINFQGGALHDDTSFRNDMSFDLQVGVSLPIFDRNQGNIYQAESQLIEAHQLRTAARNMLTAQMAEIHARYLSQRALAKNYREEILPDQVRTYRGVYRRYREGADPVDFAQIVVTQQQLGQSISQYLDRLEAKWLALVDLAEILQADDLFYLNPSASPREDGTVNNPGLPVPERPAPAKP